jgi:DNA polymerase sigma
MLTGQLHGSGKLLFGFFQYYATAWDVTTLMISVRNGAPVTLPMPLRSRSIQKGQKWLICIEDPFDHHDNVARNVNKVKLSHFSSRNLV